MESRAAAPDEWTRVASLLRPSAFDHAGSVACSAATINHQHVEQSVIIQGVIDALSPSEDPRHLGRLDGYEVTRVIGAGGMGVVLKALDTSLDRVVAIKVMTPHLAHNAAARKRFSREAKAAAAVLQPGALLSISNMGFLLGAQGKLAEAEPYSREALAGRRRVLGDEHPNTLISIGNDALLLADLNRGEEALALTDEAVETGRRILGDDSWQIGNLLGKRGRALQVLERSDEAAEVMREAHPILTAAIGDEHEQTQRVVGYLADLYDQWHEAQPGAGHDVSAAEWRARLINPANSDE